MYRYKDVKNAQIFAFLTDVMPGVLEEISGRWVYRNTL